MRLVIISEHSTPASRGVYNRHFELAKELRRQGVETEVVVSSFHHFFKKPYEVSKNLSFVSEDDGNDRAHVIKVLKYNGAHSYKRIINWLIFTFRLFIFRKSLIRKDDVILISSPSPFPILFGLYYRLLKKSPMILEIRDIWPLTLIEIGGKSKFHPLILSMKILEYYGYKYSSAIVSTLAYANKHISSLTRRDVKFCCIPQGYDPELFDKKNALDPEYVRKYIPQDKFIICYAGTIALSNSLEVFIECSKLMQEYESILFLLVGEGQYRDHFQKLTVDQSNIVFAPAINKNQVQSLLNHVDVTYDSIRESRLYDFGLSRNKWIDYMIASKPILFSGQRKGITMISEADYVFIVPPENPVRLKDKIIELYKMDSNKLLEIGRRGKHFIEANRSYTKLASNFRKEVLNVI